MSFTHGLDAIRTTGLVYRGGFHPEAGDLAPPETGTLLLLGFTGTLGWDAFANSPEAQDGLPDPLDRWSRRQIDMLAKNLGATPLYPFGGPPHHPFQLWAQKAEPVSPSPLGLLIHPEFGLFHAYRGALAFQQKLTLPPKNSDSSPYLANPCQTCAAKPCLSACPVAAFSTRGYEVETCVAHLHTPAQTCLGNGCLARSACPVGAEFHYSAAQTRFYMAAFYKARSTPPMAGHFK